MTTDTLSLVPTCISWRTAVVAGALGLLSACGGGGSSSAGDIPVIRVGPAAVTAVNGGSARFSVSVDGTGLVYQWQVSLDQGATWADIAGATGAEYVIDVAGLLLTGRWYRVRITGGGQSVSSDPARLVVACSPLASRMKGRAFYDACLDVTWLADANLAAARPLGVAGIAADGSMQWPVARAWVQALNTSAYLGRSDWRLPLVRPLNGSTYQLSGPDLDNRTGKLDLGFNISAPGSRYAGSTAHELDFLFYNQLGALAAYALDGSARGTLVNSFAPFAHVATDKNYWTGTAYGSGGAYSFNFDNGGNGAYVAEWSFKVLALRDGDIGAAP